MAGLFCFAGLKEPNRFGARVYYRGQKHGALSGMLPRVHLTMLRHSRFCARPFTHISARPWDPRASLAAPECRTRPGPPKSTDPPRRET